MGSQNRILWLLVLIASTLLVSLGVVATRLDPAESPRPAATSPR